MGKGRILPLTYYGGKTLLSDWIQSYFPRHTTYVEVFGGSGGVLLTKPLVNVNIYNDIDGDLVNFFRVLRDNPKELIRKLKFTPFSRKEFYICRDTFKSEEEIKKIDDTERARRFFVMLRQSFSIKGESWAFRVGTDQITEEDLLYDTSRGGGCDHSEKFRSAISVLAYYSNVLTNIQIENVSYEKLFELYDFEDALFYLDPPYVEETRKTLNAYRFDWRGEEDHKKLSKLVHNMKGMAVISGYNSKLYKKLYEDFEMKTKEVNLHSARVYKTNGKNSDNKYTERQKKVEVLWLNKNLSDRLNVSNAGGQLRLV